MRILPEHEWPFYDPELDRQLEDIKGKVALLRSADEPTVYGHILDVDLAFRNCLPYLAVSTTTRHAASLLLSISSTLKAIDDFRVEDLREMMTVLEIADDFEKLLTAIINEIKHGPGTVFVPLEFAA